MTYLRLYLMGALQVGLITLQTWLISRAAWPWVFGVGFAISYVWSHNVRRVAFGTERDRWCYASGAATGAVLGLAIGRMIA